MALRVALSQTTQYAKISDPYMKLYATSENTSQVVKPQNITSKKATSMLMILFFEGTKVQFNEAV